MLAKENPRWGGPLDFMIRFTASKNNYTAKTACWHYGCFHGSKTLISFYGHWNWIWGICGGQFLFPHTRFYKTKKAATSVGLLFFPPLPLPLHLFNFLPTSLPFPESNFYCSFLSPWKKKVGNRLFLLAPEAGRGEGGHHRASAPLEFHTQQAETGHHLWRRKKSLENTVSWIWIGGKKDACLNCPVKDNTEGRPFS